MSNSGREIVRNIYRSSVLINNFYKEQIGQAMATVGKELDLPGKTKFSQYFILCELHQSKEITLTELSEAVGVTLPNVSNTVNELIALGLAKRTGDKEDRRKSVIQITDLGIEFGEKIIPQCVHIFSTLYSDEEQAVNILSYYDDVLERIAKLNK